MKLKMQMNFKEIISYKKWKDIKKPLIQDLNNNNICLKELLKKI